jgi:hypothetical protein
LGLYAFAFGDEDKGSLLELRENLNVAITVVAFGDRQGLTQKNKATLLIAVLPGLVKSMQAVERAFDVKWSTS